MQYVDTIVSLYQAKVKPVLPIQASELIGKYSTLLSDVSSPYFNKTSSIVDQVKFKVHQVQQNVVEKTSQAKEFALEKSTQAKEIAVEYSTQAKEFALEKTNLAKEFAHEKSIQAKEFTSHAKDYVPTELPTLAKVQQRLSDLNLAEKLQELNLSEKFKSVVPVTFSQTFAQFMSKAKSFETIPITSRATQLFQNVNETYHLDQRIKQIDQQLKVSQTVKGFNDKYHVDQYIPQGIRSRVFPSEQ